MKEIKPESGLTDPAELEQAVELEPLLVNTGPSETELVIIGLLMRIYDAQMALLGAHYEEAAAELWDIHEAGGHRNPTMWIPSPQEPGTVDSPPKDE